MGLHHRTLLPQCASSTSATKGRLTNDEKYVCFQPGLNRRPCACEAHVITATLWKLVMFVGCSSASISQADCLKSEISYHPIWGSQDLWIKSPTPYPLR